MKNKNREPTPEEKLKASTEIFLSGKRGKVPDSFIPEFINLPGAVDKNKRLNIREFIDNTNPISVLKYLINTLEKGVK